MRGGRDDDSPQLPLPLCPSVMQWMANLQKSGVNRVRPSRKEVLKGVAALLFALRYCGVYPEFLSPPPPSSRRSLLSPFPARW